ncbi:MAG: HAMP domain-containing sensor histidine kinase [Candidatus Omnitrophota bacterium]
MPIMCFYKILHRDESMKRLKEILSNQSRPFIFFSGLILVMLVSYFDYVTGYQLSFFLFYFIPIAFVTWFGGLYPGLTIALISAMMWFMVEYLARLAYPDLLIIFHNSCIRLLAFSILSYSLWHIQVYRQKTKELIEFIVHDLRTPLSNISLGFDNLLHIDSEKLDSRQKDILNVCKISSDRMFMLINSILDFSRLENKKMVLEIKEVVIEKLVEEAFEIVSVFAQRQQVRLEKNIEVGLKAVISDYNMLLRVLVNLLSNAVRVSPPNSAVFVGVGLDGIDKVRFSIQDQGPGMPGDLVKDAFDRFVQAKARKRGVFTGGTGLGLAFCKMAIEALGGRIWLESLEAKGTAVIFIIPFKYTKAQVQS